MAMYMSAGGYPTLLDDVFFTDSGREEVAQIAETCLLAGRGVWIPELIRAGATLEAVRRKLAAAEAGQAGGSSAPPHLPADELARVGAARFLAQSARYD